jgi:outer membrane protein
MYVRCREWHQQALNGVRERRRSIAATALLIALALPAAQLAAQDYQSKWTLDELVGVALDRNLGLAASKVGITIAEADITAARGERLPRLDAVARGEYFPRRERLLIFRHGFRKDDNPFETAIVDYGLEVTLPLYTSGRIEHGIALAEALAATSRSRVQLTRNQLIFNVASAYYTALRIQQVIGAQEVALSSLKESLRIAELQREVGRIAPLDSLRIETGASQAERDLAGARNAHEQVIEVLKELINVPTEVALEVAGQLVKAPAAGQSDLLREQALAQRPDLIALRQEVGAQRAAVGIADSRLGPSLDLKAGFRGVTGIDDGTTRDDGTLLLQFRVPLYEGGVFRAQRRKALAQLRQTELRLRDAERRALAEVARAVLDLNAADPRTRAAVRAVEQAQESLRVEREKFTQGRGTSNDLLLAERALLSSRTELAAVLSDSQIAQAALNLAVGNDPVATASSATAPSQESN